MDNPESIELRELRDQQAATSEILRAISRMPTDLEPICEMILQKATALADTEIGNIALYQNGNVFRAIAKIGPDFAGWDQIRGQQVSAGRSLFREQGPWRPLHIHDLKESKAYQQGEYLAVMARRINAAHDALGLEQKKQAAKQEPLFTTPN